MFLIVTPLTALFSSYLERCLSDSEGKANLPTPEEGQQVPGSGSGQGMPPQGSGSGRQLPDLHQAHQVLLPEEEPRVPFLEQGTEKVLCGKGS